MSLALVSAGIPRGIVATISSLSASRWAIFSFIVVMYLILGCLVDALSLMLLTLPVCSRSCRHRASIRSGSVWCS